jgi:hypothetical protein
MAFDNYPAFSEIQQVAGLLFWGTTSLANEAGWGTKLGYVEKGIELLARYGYEERAGAYDDQPIFAIATGQAPRLIAYLRNYNATALARIFPGLTDSTKIRFPGDISAGADLLSDHSGRLLFVPDDRDNHPIALFQKAVPRVIATARLRFSHADRLIFPTVFSAFPKTDDEDGVAYIGPIGSGVLR